jgi:hypothetical protein
MPLAPMWSELSGATGQVPSPLTSITMPVTASARATPCRPMMIPSSDPQIGFKRLAARQLRLATARLRGRADPSGVVHFSVFNRL